MSLVLVTGGTGLLGSTLARRLVESGKHVRILRRASSPLELLEDISDQVDHAIGDLNDVDALDRAVEGASTVYHTAAAVSLGGRGEKVRLMRVNVDGTGALVDSSIRAGVRRLVHTSSIAAFGRPENPSGLINEDSEWYRSKVNSAYARSKYLSELEVHRGIAEGLDAVIVNPSLIFGKGRAGENTMRIVERLRSEALPAIPSGGTNVVDVLDVADGMIRAMDHGRTGERYLLGSENLTWKQIVNTLANAFRTQPPRRTLTRNPAMALAILAELWSGLTRVPAPISRATARTVTRVYKYSNRKAVEELGCSFRPFAATAARLAAELAMDP